MQCFIQVLHTNFSFSFVYFLFRFSNVWLFESESKITVASLSWDTLIILHDGMNFHLFRDHQEGTETMLVFILRRCIVKRCFKTELARIRTSSEKKVGQLHLTWCSYIRCSISVYYGTQIVFINSRLLSRWLDIRPSITACACISAVISVSLCYSGTRPGMRKNSP